MCPVHWIPPVSIVMNYTHQILQEIWLIYARSYSRTIRDRDAVRRMSNSVSLELQSNAWFLGMLTGLWLYKVNCLHSVTIAVFMTNVEQFFEVHNWLTYKGYLVCHLIKNKLFAKG